jgi:hypothetical protein
MQTGVGKRFGGRDGSLAAPSMPADFNSSVHHSFSFMINNCSFLSRQFGSSDDGASRFCILSFGTGKVRIGDMAPRIDRASAGASDKSQKKTLLFFEDVGEGKWF